MEGMTLTALLLLGASCAGVLGGGVLQEGEDPLKVSDREWQERLTPEQYSITRDRGTERAFSGEYVYHKEKGTYNCVCCGAVLFSSTSKYDSGSGWPSFYEAVLNDKGNSNVTRKADMSHGMRRVEVTCKQCDAHLGHVFDDGPQPTNERFCINSAALKFEPDKH